MTDMELELPSDDDGVDLPSEVEDVPVCDDPPNAKLKVRKPRKKPTKHPKSLAQCCRDYDGTFGPQQR